MILEADGPTERVRVVGSPIHMEAAPVAIRIVPAGLGEHTDAVLGEIGLSPLGKVA